MSNDNKTLNKPFRNPTGSSKKFSVYVKHDGNIKKISFGNPNMEIRRDNPEARENFRARHNCDEAKDRTTPKYWSCKMWEAEKSVNEIINAKQQFIEKACGELADYNYKKNNMKK